MTSANMLSWSLDQPWFIWALVLVLLFPLLIVGLGEWINRLEKVGSSWVNPLKHLRHLVLPQLVILLIMTRVLALPGDNFWVRIVETALWILVIHTALSLLDPLVLGRITDGSRHWSTRIPKLVVDFARAFLVMIGASLVLSDVWGVELGRMLTALGVGSVVLGLALQDTLGSLFSGVTLLSTRQFRVGDWLRIGDHEQGKIVDMNWRSVTLLTRDEDVIIVPNSELAKGHFVNFSYPYPRHRERVQFDLSFDDPPYLVKQVLAEAARATPGVLHDPPPSVALISYDEFSVKHEVQYFIDAFHDQPKILDNFKSRVWYVAKRHGISFPTRAHEVLLVQPEAQGAVSEQQKIHDILVQHPLLNSKRNMLSELCVDASILDYGSGEEIITQGCKSDALYIINQGQVIETYTDIAGEEHLLNKLGTNDLFGLTALVRREPNRVGVHCLCDVRIIAIQEVAAHRLLESSPELAIQIEQIIESRTRALTVIERESSKHKKPPEDAETAKDAGKTGTIQSFLDW